MAHELEDLYSAPQTDHARLRRDEEAVNKEKCRMHHPKLCCAENALEAYTDTETKRECFKEVVGDFKKQGPSPDPFKCHNMEQHKKDVVVCSLNFLVKMQITLSLYSPTNIAKLK